MQHRESDLIVSSWQEEYIDRDPDIRDTGDSFSATSIPKFDGSAFDQACVSSISERTPLLNSLNISHLESARHVEGEDPHFSPSPCPPTPLPRSQLLILCLIRLTEPLCYTVIFPFVNRMISDLGFVGNEKDVGLFAGWVESVFGLTQLFTVFYWSSLSDRIGRKPVIVLGLLGVAVSVCIFGLSKSFGMMLISRALAGALSGNIAVCRTVIGEITDRSNQAVAFSLLPLCWGLGAVVAAMIGGYLARPVERYPSLFGTSRVLSEYPYLLPCLVAALFPAVAVLLAIFFLKESNPTITNKFPGGTNAFDASTRDESPLRTSGSESTLVDGEYFTFPKEGRSPDRTLTLTELLAAPNIKILLFNYGFLTLQVMLVSSIIPLYCFTRVEDGGLGYSEAEIGNAQLVEALAVVFMQLVLFPYLMRKMGTWKLLRYLMALFPVSFVLLACLNPLARVDGMAKPAVGVGLWTALVLFSMANMSYACNFILLNDATPTPSSRGALNGLAQMLECLTRAIAPAASNSLFAISKESGVLGGQLVWVVIVLMGLGGIASTMRGGREKR